MIFNQPGFSCDIIFKLFYIALKYLKYTIHEFIFSHHTRLKPYYGKEKHMIGNAVPRPSLAVIPPSKLTFKTGQAEPHDNQRRRDREA